MNILKPIILAIICTAVVFVSSGLPIQAADPHEDPEKTLPVFSGIALFNYYSETLDFVLAKNPHEVTAKMEKMPFANLPDNLTETTNDFVSNIDSIAPLIVTIEKDMDELRGLIQQSRFDESAFLVQKIKQEYSVGYIAVKQAKQDVIITGNIFNVGAAATNRTLRVAYDNVLEKINRITALLDLQSEILADLQRGIITSLTGTKLTLTIEPGSAFVGDNVVVQGNLTGGGQLLGGRDIDILFDGSRYVLATTDSNGHFETTVSIPYRYVPQIQVQVLYYPRSGDVGVYASSLSPIISLNILFYKALPDIQLADKAYPGLETSISGGLNYDSSVHFIERKVEINLDNTLVAEVDTSDRFSRQIRLSQDIRTGKHTVTISAIGNGRYAPVFTSGVLNVTKAIPQLRTSLSTIVLVPGSFHLGGQLQSELGPLQQALITMNLSRSTVEVKSADDGTFNTEMGMRMGFGLVGSDNVTINVSPQEPWNDTLSITRKVLLLNVINCGVFLAIFVGFGVFVSRKLRRQIQAYWQKRVSIHQHVIIDARQEPSPVYSAIVTNPAVPDSITEIKGGKSTVEPRIRVFYLYTMILKLVQRIARRTLKPQYTLREFVQETQKTPGPIAVKLLEFTRIVEKLLYSRHEVTERDIGDSQRLASQIQDEFKNENP